MSYWEPRAGRTLWKRASKGPLLKRLQPIFQTKIRALGSLTRIGTVRVPHKRLADDALWGIVSGRVKLMVEPGRRQLIAQNCSQTFKSVDVPLDPMHG
jgi:hypothetical protein